MKARWSRTALIELDNIFSYISERSPAAAKSVVLRIEALVAHLEQFPARGHHTDEPEVRAISVVRYPYVILYAIDPTADEVIILHIRHTARKPPAEE
jgi:plasmid stabilization system protein ParE